jgi:hypothetical protein
LAEGGFQGYRHHVTSNTKDSHSTDGKATLKSPPSGWATSALAVGFGTTYTSASRSATRSIPALSSSATPTTSGMSAQTSSASSAAKNVSHVGAIAGGAVGGVVVLTATIALILLCMRSRRKQAQPSITNTAPNSAVQDKHFSMSQGSTAYSPHPQGSPRPLSDSRGFDTQLQHQSPGSDWIQPQPLAFVPQHETHQVYYPPPHDPSHSPRSVHSMSVELPIARTPAQPSELSGVRSPQPTRGRH